MKEGLLKKCPFCGGTAVLTRVSTGHSSDYWEDTWKVECYDCKATLRNTGFKTCITRTHKGEIVIENDGREEAINNWNTRKEQ